MMKVYDEDEDLFSDAEDIGSLEKVYEGIPATPDFISPNFPWTYHQKDLNLCVSVYHRQSF